MANEDEKMINDPELSDREHLIETTLQPGRKIVVNDAELTDLTRMGVVVKDDAEDETEEEESNEVPAVSASNATPAGSGTKSGSPKNLTSDGTV